jgi:hypothetical protein
MRCKVTVVGELPSLRDRLADGGYAEVVGDEELPGSDVVVLARGADVAGAARRVAARAPGAVIVVVEGDVRTALEASLLPRGRVIGVAADAVVPAAEAIMFDRRTAVEVELVGLDGDLVSASAVLGLQGVRRLA